MFAVATLFLALFSLCNGANILAIFPMPSYSHQLVYQTLAQGLANRGHNVTVVSPVIIKVMLTEICFYLLQYVKNPMQTTKV